MFSALNTISYNYCTSSSLNQMKASDVKTNQYSFDPLTTLTFLKVSQPFLMTWKYKYIILSGDKGTTSILTKRTTTCNYSLQLFIVIKNKQSMATSHSTSFTQWKALRFVPTWFTIFLLEPTSTLCVALQPICVNILIIFFRSQIINHTR